MLAVLMVWGDSMQKLTFATVAQLAWEREHGSQNDEGNLPPDSGGRRQHQWNEKTKALIQNLTSTQDAIKGNLYL